MALLAVQIGKRIEKDVQRYFPEEKQTVFLPYLPHVQFGSDDIRPLVTEFYRKLSELCRVNAQPVKIVLSGPVALAFMFGMMAGYGKFNVEIYHLNLQDAKDEYIRVDSPNTRWTEPR